MIELRERIANVLLPDLEYAAAYNPIQDPQEQAYTLADAVIEALDLRIEDKYKTASGQKLLFGVSGFFEVEVDGD